MDKKLWTWQGAMTLGTAQPCPWSWASLPRLLSAINSMQVAKGLSHVVTPFLRWSLGGSFTKWPCDANSNRIKTLKQDRPLRLLCIDSRVPCHLHLLVPAPSQLFKWEKDEQSPDQNAALTLTFSNVSQVCQSPMTTLGAKSSARHHWSYYTCGLPGQAQPTTDTGFHPELRGRSCLKGHRWLGAAGAQLSAAEYLFVTTLCVPGRRERLLTPTAGSHPCPSRWNKR